MQISSLTDDIQRLLLRKDGWFTDAIRDSFATEVGLRLQAKFNEGISKPTLRMSKLGPSCPKALWHSIHTPELAEELPPWAEFKFAYGHIIEALAIALAKGAGHSVVGEQDALILDGVSGHRDCVIDGCVVDVKSTTSFYLKRFKDKSILQNDSFGYLDQLDAYIVGSAADPLVTVKDRGYLLGVDKTLGHMVLYCHHVREQSIRDRIKDHKRIIASTQPPACTCGTRAEGKSGNIGLDTKASYSAFKFCCFPHLRTFLYADGPTYLTKVVRKPDVVEINRQGQIISSW